MSSSRAANAMPGHMTKSSLNDWRHGPERGQFYELRRETTRDFYDIRRMKKKQSSTLFGRRLREARLRFGIPQDKLGVRIGLDEHTASARISRYETGENEPPFGTAVNLAEVLRLPAAYFYCEDDEIAELVLAWPHLSKAVRKQIKALIPADVTDQ